MMLTRVGTVAVLCAFLGACATNGPVTPPVQVAALKRADVLPRLPRECKAVAEAWKKLPTNATLADLARAYEANKVRYRRLSKSQRICAAAIKASGLRAL